MNTLHYSVVFGSEVDNSVLPRLTKLAKPNRESISSTDLNVAVVQHKRVVVDKTAYRPLISDCHVMSLSAGAFSDAPIIPKTRAIKASNTIYITRRAISRFILAGSL